MGPMNISRELISPGTSVKRKFQERCPAGKLHDDIIEALHSLHAVKGHYSLSGEMKAAFEKVRPSSPTTLFKTILMALPERDEVADVCLDYKGNPAPDPELPDYANLPLKGDTHDYVVFLHVPEAWVEEYKSKAG